MKWSLCMIVKNEENVLKRCLESVAPVFDEIIIVDTGSVDRTVEIAKEYTDKIFHFTWIDDFSAARNEAFKHATGDYVMWLDADDVIQKEDFLKLKELKANQTNDEIDIYMFAYNTAFDQDGHPTFSFFRERLIKNNGKYVWIDRVHEYIPLTGKIEYVEIAITHQSAKKELSDRNLKIYEKMKEDKIPFTPRNQYYYARELYDHGYYEDAIQMFTIFLKEEKGWVEDNINACTLIATAYEKLKQPNQTLTWLLQTFQYDVPRTKVCCLIGNWFLNKNENKKAIYWYETCLHIPYTQQNGFHEKDYDQFIPCLNLCVAYDHLKEYEKAYLYHKMTKQLKPDNPSVLYNETYFETKNKDKEY